MRNLFGETISTTIDEILDNAPLKPCGENAVLIAFSGGNDSRCMTYAVLDWFKDKPFKLELAAIDTGLAMDGWKESILEFADAVNLPVSFWSGDGRDYYTRYVNQFGWPGNVAHAQIQNHLKGRAYRKMVRARRNATPKKMADSGTAVWVLSGIRKNESRKRQLLKTPYSWREGIQFINPLFYWSNADVIDYMIANDIPFAPGKQWDCKCGATVKDAEAEWSDICQNAPKLHEYIIGLKPKCAWEWASFSAVNQQTNRQIEAGQMWIDDGSLEAYPTCVNCVRDLMADEDSSLSEW